MTVTGYVILVVLVTIAAIIYMELASLPGKTARQRGHPNADAISTLSWLGLLMVVPWIIAMVWARMQPIEIAFSHRQGVPAAEDDQTAEQTDDQADP